MRNNTIDENESPRWAKSVCARPPICVSHFSRWYAVSHIFLIALLSSSAHSAEKSPAATSKILLTNGDRISGSVIRSSEATLEFESPHFPQAATLNKSTILDIELDPSHPNLDIDTQQADHIAEIQLKGRYQQEDQNDTLFGQLKTINDTSLTLNTWYAGELEIDRSLIHSITLHPNFQPLYKGPNSIEEWNNFGSQGSWQYRDNSLTSSDASATIAKDLQLPDQAVLNFTLRWDNNLAIALHLFGDSADQPRAKNYYELRLQTSYLNMRKRIEQKEQVDLTRLPSERYSPRDNSAEYTIYMDKKKGLFHVFVDNNLVQTFQDVSPTPQDLGTSLFFLNENGQNIRISNIQMTAWNGTLLTDEDRKALNRIKGDGQKILLSNGDVVLGKIGQIKDGSLSVETEHTPLEIPLFGISELSLPPTTPNQPKMEARDIKAYFKRGGWIILQLDSLDKNALIGTHPAIGSATFRLDAFQKLELNIYDEELQSQRAEANW